MESVSIIIPAYNEEKRIERTLREYWRYFIERKKSQNIGNFEILVVCNACRDNTLKIVKKEGESKKEIKSLNFVQGGKGFAIVEGFKSALKQDFDLIGFVDADMATPPEAFYALINAIGKNDGVIASRWLKESQIKTEQTMLRKITSRGFNFLTRSILFLPYKDTQCGAKLFRNGALKKVIKNIGVTEWAFDIDLLYKLNRNGAKIKEVPTIWEDQSGSKINLKKVPFQMFSSIIRLRLIYSPFRFIVRLYNKFPEKWRLHRFYEK